jgi:hypothetical protein
MQKHAANALLAVVMFVTPVAAQRGGGIPSHSFPRSAMSFSPRVSQRDSFPQAVLLGAPFWMDGFSSSSYTPTPSVIVVQTPGPAAPPAPSAEETKPATPLMIEWQGDRYVRRTELNGTATQHQPDYIAEAKPSPGKHTPATPQLGTTSPATPLSPATFVFRDGHREQSSDYSIISGVIYARGDYWTNGYWAKQIPVSQLDVPATFQANQELGVPFRLPGAPNEVVTRP